ncbi:MAG: metalloregulator ArsR/SmtB family transcription factor [Lachnospiraceae bacterium]|jgi:DNA-binding transcriptional ArsR family regulator|nr:metalloregulator ArsR/SmtB family transcription factor [Lachnospiraceae bacterium]
MKQKEPYEIPVCACRHNHAKLIASLKEQTPDEATLLRLAELFKIFGDPTRIKILYALLGHEMCVCDIAQLLGMSQSSISHQLRILKQTSLVKFRREGKMVFYSLADEHVMTILSQGFDHVTE